MPTRKCCICGAPIYFGYNYLCKNCWRDWKDHIAEAWLKALISFEQKEREYTQNYSRISTSFEELQETENNE